MGVKTALVTGASSGIGLALAQQFAEHGYNLILIARHMEGLQAAAKSLQKDNQPFIKLIQKDLSAPQAAQEIFTELQDDKVFVDVLVNNAGIAVYGNFWERSLEEQLSVVQINMATLTALTRLFLPSMLARKSGKILNVASTAAFQPGPQMATYYASKSYVVSFSYALARELKGSGVTTTCLCPGPTNTPFRLHAHMGNARMFSGLISMQADAVAKIGYKATMKGRPLVIAGFKNRLGTIAVRLLPMSLTSDTVHFLHQRRKP